MWSEKKAILTLSLFLFSCIPITAILFHDKYILSIRRWCRLQFVMLSFWLWKSIWSLAWFNSDSTAFLYMFFHPIAVGLFLHTYCTNKPLSTTSERSKTLCMSYSLEALNVFLIPIPSQLSMWHWCRCDA